VPEFGQFAFSFFGVSLSANGVVAAGLAVPVAILLIAVAVRIARSPAQTLGTIEDVRRSVAGE
jgi:hypothetical protein